MAREEGFFDELARGLADGSITRGKALRLMGAALLGGTLGSLGIGEAGADRPGCKRIGKNCTRDTQCCGSLVCVSGTCQTPTTTTTETPTTTTTETPTTSTSTSTTSTSTTPMCQPNGGFCFSDDSECCSGNCSNSFCCPAGWMGLSNGTCAMLCTTGSECGAGCTCVSGSSGSFCGTGTGSGRSCLDDDLECPTGEFCVG